MKNYPAMLLVRRYAGFSVDSFVRPNILYCTCLHANSTARTFGGSYGKALGVCSIVLHDATSRGLGFSGSDV